MECLRAIAGVRLIYASRKICSAACWNGWYFFALLLEGWEKEESYNGDEIVTVLNNSFGNSYSRSSWGISLLRGEGSGFWRMTHLPPVPFWKSLCSFLQFQSNDTIKPSHQAHLLLMSSAFHGKMPNPYKTSSCGPPRATGLIQWQDCRRVVFHSSDAGAAVVPGSCSFQQAWRYHRSD